MPDPSSLRRETLIQHLGEEDSYLGAVAPPLVMTSTFVFDKVDDFSKAFHPNGKPVFAYSRISNPTVHMAEQKIAALEKAEAAKLFSSGMAAISAAIMSCVKHGSHVVAVDTVYGPTRQFLSHYLEKFGVTVTYVKGTDPQDFERACTENTTLFVLESPSSMFFYLQDLKAVAAIAKSRGITTMLDNSYSSPWLQQPIEHGIDIVVHSASKYLGGHSDLVAGCLACSKTHMEKIIKDELALFGGIIHPFGAWQILRSLRTLPIKIKAVAECADVVCEFLKKKGWVSQVFHLGDPDFDQAELRDAQMSGWSGLLSFTPKDQDFSKIKVFLEELKLFGLGVSWGGHESLAVASEQQPIGFEEKIWLVRLYCGLEHPEDLCADLEMAAEKAGWVRESARSSQ